MSRYFSDKETACKCGCGDFTMEPEFMDKLDRLREIIGRPLVLTSAKRCAAHNKAVSTVSNGPHPLGVAADIQSLSSRMRFELIKAALDAGFTRIGVAKSFIHVDCGEIVNPGVYVKDMIWIYGDR